MWKFVGIISITLLPYFAQAQSLTLANGTQEPLISQLIIKLKPTSAGMRPAMTSTTLTTLAANTASNLRYKRPMSGSAHVLYLPYPMTREQAESYAKTVSLQSNIEYAQPDYLKYLATIPSDTYYSGSQWNLQSPATYPGAINAVQAWDETTGSSAVTIAVVDAGITPSHPDLTGRGVPELAYGGYDMVINNTSVESGDGDDRDTNPTETDTSWHGTHVTGIIGAKTNNSLGISGIDWNAYLLYVRVFGSSDAANTSDVIDGIRWAAGDPQVSNGTSTGGYLPVNPRPAKVINLSLGGLGLCNKSEQEAIDYAYGRGANVVVAAGNGCSMVGLCSAQYSNVETGLNLDTVPHSPANCNNVITVAAVASNGQKATFSNYGSPITVAAPGMYAIGSTQGILSTVGGTTQYGYIAGTSQAAPHVSGVIGLMLTANSTLTPAQIKAALKASARPYPYADRWQTQLGAGLLDACRAVRYVKGLSMDSCANTGAGTLVATTDWNATPTTPTTTIGSSGGGGGGNVDSLLLALLASLAGFRFVKRRSLA
ncbi:S8 family serine peptidase [Thiofilum flexile]|uniref:S8 family serine peptidase n=1 Tax=Thiofilum flexile TaxID=125627 RepID=UPI00037D8911|nr:S8 family serine peptidase [Thiofilum flexile]